MKVYEIKLKLVLLNDIKLNDGQIEICNIIDSFLAKDEKWLEFHKDNKFKNYCFNSFYPLEEDKIYKKDKVYSLIIRTIDKDLAEYFNENLHNSNNDMIRCLTSNIRIIPKKHIEKIYSITPIVIKTDNGYWKDILSLKEFEERIKINLIKKYNEINNTKINEDFDFYTNLEFKNKKPCSINYKNVKLLGDKISLNISDDKISQKLAYMALGTGIGEMNSRGLGMVNFRYL